MPMDIPTYKVGTFNGYDLYLQSPYKMLRERFTNGMYAADGSRFYYDVMLTGNSSPLYGPGSVTYKIIKCESVVSGNPDAITGIPIDPKTYIDNYGYIHIGESNLPDDGEDAPTIRVTFKCVYHYINPTTGDSIVEESDDLYFNTDKWNGGHDVDNWRSIPYAYAPGNTVVS